MFFIGDQCAHILADYIEANGGLAQRMKEQLGDEEFARLKIKSGPVIRAQIATNLLETSQASTFPICQVYCKKTENRLGEKFREVSGTAEVVIQCTVTGESLEGLAKTMSAATSSLTEILSRRRGTLMPGVYMSGAWGVTLEPVQAGGRKFVESCKVIVEIEIRKSERNCQ